MGIKGTEAAKQAAEMVLADDKLRLHRARGRGGPHGLRQHQEIDPVHPADQRRRGPDDPGGHRPRPAATRHPAQILWVNMITAVTLALALAFEPAESDVMRRSPRDPREPLLTGFMLWRIGYVSLLMVTATFGLFLWERAQGTEIDTARTVAVNTLVIAEVFYLLTVRYIQAPALTPCRVDGQPGGPDRHRAGDRLPAAVHPYPHPAAAVPHHRPRCRGLAAHRRGGRGDPDRGRAREAGGPAALPAKGAERAPAPIEDRRRRPTFPWKNRDRFIFRNNPQTLLWRRQRHTRAWIPSNARYKTECGDGLTRMLIDNRKTAKVGDTLKATLLCKGYCQVKRLHRNSIRQCGRAPT